MNKPATNAKAGSLSLGHILIVGAIGGWILAAQLSENSGDAFSKLTTLQRVFQPGFLGLTAGMAAGPIGAGIVGWLVAKAIPRLQAYAPHTALLLTVSVFLMSLAGGNIQNKQQAKLTSQVDNISIPAVAEQGWDLSSLSDVLEGRWELISTNQTAKTYIDTQSTSGNTYQSAVWLKRFLKSPSSARLLDERSPDYVTEIMHIFIRCEDRSWALGDVHYYATSGTEVSGDYFDDNKKTFSSIQPGDVNNEKLFKMLCVRAD